MKFEGYLYDVIEIQDSAAPDSGVHDSMAADGLSASSDAACAFLIALRPDSPVYAGHFPGFPVTPGVALLTIVRELLETRLHKSLTLASADDVKFLRPLTPDNNPVTVIFREFGNDGVKAEISSAAGLHARMNLSYRGGARI